MTDVQPHIAVVGSYGVGLWIVTPAIPAAGETVLGRDFAIGPGGKGSNQAIGIARLGAQVSLLASVGNDQFGTEARALWAREGLDASAVLVQEGAPTMAGFIILDETGENRIITDPGANALLQPSHVDAFGSRIAQSNILLCQMEIPVECVVQALKIARTHGVTTILNPAPAQALDSSVLPLVDILTPNQSEARRLLDLPPEDPIADDIVAARLLSLGVGAVVMTLGAEGALVVDRAGSEVVPGHTVPVVDTTGAGDGFNAALAVAILRGSTLIEAVRFATVVGAYVVTISGVVPALPTQSDLRSFRPL